MSEWDGEIHRRAFLARLAGGTLPVLAAAPRLWAEPPNNAYPGQIIRQREPVNLEYPFPTLHEFLTPNERFYTRCHFAIPKIDVSSWKLKVEGAVERPLELSYDELRKLPSRSLVALLECAGNSRVFLVPQARGVGWELGAVSNAEWTGVPLVAILEKAGLKNNAVEVVLEGADQGEVKSEPQSPGPIHFARGLPVEKARHPDVLLAYGMNGVDLPAAHGYPLRAVVAGWYGVASIKWLSRIIVLDKPFQGFFQTIDYSIFERRQGLPALVPITAQLVKAEIARPAAHEVVPANQAYRVFGAAWAGEPHVTKVEVSTDGGASWNAARLLDKPVRYAWRFWEYEWRTPGRPGAYTLMARATDSKGRSQSLKRDPDRRNYMVNHVLPVRVEVR